METIVKFYQVLFDLNAAATRLEEAICLAAERPDVVELRAIAARAEACGLSGALARQAANIIIAEAVKAEAAEVIELAEEIGKLNEGGIPLVRTDGLMALAKVVREAAQQLERAKAPQPTQLALGWVEDAFQAAAKAAAKKAAPKAAPAAPKTAPAAPKSAAEKLAAIAASKKDA